ncbi:5-formyltetrahydrofolate cyclo-ligase [Priestia megaterium]|nr:5-formyltetrahydrofolate cyclo-ligase [Priestia megaterium]
MDKKQIRKEVKQRLHSLSSEDYKINSRRIVHTLFQTDWWKKAKVIAVTVSRGKEVDTQLLIEQAWSQQKIVVVPKCNPSTYEMIFRKITSFSQLETVYFGLKEPIERETVAIAKEEIDLIVVPGIAYSRNGHRVGYGGGYYDRFLASFTKPKISLAFKEQLVSDVPYNHYDIPVDAIITNLEMIDCGHH